MGMIDKVRHAYLFYFLKVYAHIRQEKHTCADRSSPFLSYFIKNHAFLLHVSYKFAIFASCFIGDTTLFAQFSGRTATS